MRAVGLRDLQGERPYPAAATIDQHLLPRPPLTQAPEVLQGDEPGGRDGGGLRERDVVRLPRQQVLADGHKLGERAAVDPCLGDDRLAEYRVTRAKLRHALADALDDPRHVGTGDRVFGSGEPGSHQAEDIRLPGHDVPDIWMDGSRVNPYQDLVILDDWLVDFSELEDIR